MRKTFFALLMAVFVLSFWIGTADAAWTSSFTTAKKILQNTNATTLASQSAANVIAYTLGTGETLNTNDTIQITLSGGAKFSSTAPVMKTTGGTTFASIVGTPTGTTTANFRVDLSALIPTDVIYLNTEGTIFDVSAVTGNVDVTMKATTSVGGLTIFDSAQSSVTGATMAFSAPSASESVYISAQTDTADVSATTGAYTKFTGGGVTGTVTAADLQNLAEAANTCPNGIEISANKVLYTITGTLAGLTSITANVAGQVTSSDSTGGITGTTANAFGINTAKTAAYAVNTAAIAPAGQITPDPCFTIDGTTAQQTRGFNVAVSLLADGTKRTAHTAQSATTLYTIVRNGTTFATNSIGSRNTVKITDRSGGIATTGGAITITAWDVNGNSIPESSSAAALTLMNNGTTTITGSDLAARFPTGTPMKYEFAVESSNAVIANVKDSTDGVVRTTTVYTSGVGAI